MKPAAAVQLGAGKAKSWGPPAPQFPLPSQAPGALGKGGIEGSCKEVRSESSQKIMACLPNSRAWSFLQKGHFFQDIILI